MSFCGLLNLTKLYRFDHVGSNLSLSYSLSYIITTRFSVQLKSAIGCAILFPAYFPKVNECMCTLVLLIAALHSCTMDHFIIAS